ncbi:UDP-glucose 4-epimerase [Pyrococcus sp. NA2]|uniref:SDR family oxidoreductase n=1 Tax=Pyrococcus sp. (strain NA2) TaxID=342949 RepID=UPI000209A907|nr:SDR family oxidoreductase [Pyrococcus sp. NA2]AEC51261.1 UDP-glucose 4-epimerase [Pyrococcus sp. NA2]
MRNKLVVITGGAGFIGSHLAEALAEDNDVVVIDNLYSGKLENIPENVKFVEADVRDYEKIADIIREADYVFHEAAQISVEESIRDPVFTEEVNVIGTINVLRALAEGEGKLIFASSAAVYGDPIELPIKEDSELRPISPYGITKLTGEHYCRVYYELYGVPIVVLRYFNVYGPRQSSAYAGVISIFMERAIRGEPLIIYGDGKQTRDFIFVKDVVDANLLVAKKERANGEVFNVATGRETMIIDLALKVIELSSSPSQIIFYPPRPGDIKRSVADIGKIRKLGFKPKYSLEEGLKETFSWFKSRIL